MSLWDGLGTALGVAQGAARGYEAAKFPGARNNGNDDQAGGSGGGALSPMMKYLRDRKFQPRRPFDMGAPGQPDMSGPIAGPPQPVPGMVGIQAQGAPLPPAPPGPPQPAQGMYPPGNPYPGIRPGAEMEQYANGGVVTKPTTAIIGEDGPEMVVPLTDRPDARVSRVNLPQMQYRR